MGTNDHSIFHGNTEMHTRMRQLDWSGTAVGSVATWPHSLRSLVRMLLTSRYPMVLTWGPEFLQFYNDAYSKLIGDKHPSALASDIRITLAEAWATLGPMIADVMRTGVANWTPALPLLLQRHGYREESYFSVSHAPAENDYGEIVGMLAVCSEVTDQVISERRFRLLRELAAQTSNTLQQSCATMARVLSGSLDVPFALFYLRDGEDAFRLAATSGVPRDNTAVPDRLSLREDHPGWPLADFLGNGRQITSFEVEQRLALRGGFFSDPVKTAIAQRIEGPSPDQPLGVIITGVSPNRSLDDAYRGFFDLLVRQITTALNHVRAVADERRRADFLAELDRSKTAFFNNVSHEFRTPLTLMLGPLEELVTTAAKRNDATQLGVLDSIHRNALRLLKLVNTLLDFARMESGKMEAKLAPVDLCAFTAEIAHAFRPAMTKAGLEYTVTCTMSGFVLVDGEMWEKLVLNLLSNALKFTVEGSVRLILSIRGTDIELQVQDTGPGIPAAAQSRLFERFYRVEGIHGRSHEGTGIGLSLVRDLADLHGGTASVESEVGVGSTFRVSIPLRRANGVDATAQSSLTSSRSYRAEGESWLQPSVDVQQHSTSDKPTVLVVDDNSDMRDYIARVLASTCQVLTAANGALALQRVSEVKPELIVSDIMMPVLDGFQFLQELRAHSATSTIPVILLSARAGEEAKVEGIRAQADDYLTKPFSAAELIARVNTLIELTRLRRDATRQQSVADEQKRMRVRLEETVAERTAELNRIVARLEAFSYNLSHDLRAPLRTIAGFVEILRAERGATLDADANEHLRRIDAAARRMARLMDDVLAALRSSRAQLNLEQLRIEEIIADVIEDRPDLQPPKSVIDVVRPLAPVIADRTGLSQCLSNLLGNAAKFVPPHKQPVVRIWTEKRNEKVRLWIEDNGIGILPKDQERLFEPFQRGDNAHKYEGTGLGLAIAREAVAKMGGAIGVQPGREGGSQFWIDLQAA